MVSFDVTGASVTVRNDAQTIQTQAGPKRADELVQGDIIQMNVCCWVTITSVPVVS